MCDVKGNPPPSPLRQKPSHHNTKLWKCSHKKPRCVSGFFCFFFFFFFFVLERQQLWEACWQAHPTCLCSGLLVERIPHTSRNLFEDQAWLSHVLRMFSHYPDSEGPVSQEGRPPSDTFCPVWFSRTAFHGLGASGLMSPWFIPSHVLFTGWEQERFFLLTCLKLNDLGVGLPERGERWQEPEKAPTWKERREPGTEVTSQEMFWGKEESKSCGLASYSGS